MLGAIAGDIIGSVYEARPIKSTRFPLFRDDCRFTDDTVLTVALADSILSGEPFKAFPALVRPGLRPSPPPLRMSARLLCHGMQWPVEPVVRMLGILRCL